MRCDRNLLQVCEFIMSVLHLPQHVASRFEDEKVSSAIP